MKKLVFSALLAIVATSGAISANAINLYTDPNAGNEVQCLGSGSPTCGQFSVLYTAEGSEAPRTEYQNLKYTDI